MLCCCILSACIIDYHFSAFSYVAPIVWLYWPLPFGAIIRVFIVSVRDLRGTVSHKTNITNQPFNLNAKCHKD